MNELRPPPEALTDPKAVEFARLWAAHRRQHVSLRMDPWQHDPNVWGVILGDLAQQVATACEQHGAGTREDVLQAIVAAFLAEFATPAGVPHGGKEDSDG